MIVRISEIEIDTNYVDEYLSILKEEAEASIRLEPGAISIFPMCHKEKPNEIRILEIYADTAVYKSHLKTPHFKHYKITMLNMVKSLKLVDMTAIDSATMPKIYKSLIKMINYAILFLQLYNKIIPKLTIHQNYQKSHHLINLVILIR